MFVGFSKIIGGKFAGTKIKIISNDFLRPTTNRVKEAIFNILQFDLENSVFLDLFCGTGQIGLEALSRGAKKVYFVEKNIQSIKILIENIRKNKNIDKYSFQIFNSDVFDFLNKYDEYLINEKINIVFLDPPYDFKLKNELLLELSNKIEKNTICVFETSYNDKPNIKIDKDLILQREYRYGKIFICYYKKI